MDWDMTFTKYGKLKKDASGGESEGEQSSTELKWLQNAFEEDDRDYAEEEDVFGFGEGLHTFWLS